MAKKDRFRWSDTDCVFTKAYTSIFVYCFFCIFKISIDLMLTQAAPICERVVLGLLEEDRIGTSGLQLAFEDMRGIEQEEEEEEISMLDGDLDPRNQ